MARLESRPDSFQGGFWDSESLAFVDEASQRLGIPRERLQTGIRAAVVLSNVELGAVDELSNLAESGVPMEKREALSLGFVRAMESLPDPGAFDPLAEVDDPMDGAEAAELLTRAETESGLFRESLLRESLDENEAAARTGRPAQALEQMFLEGRLIALSVGERNVYPEWQFHPQGPNGVVPGLDQVIRLLGLSPLGTAFWLLKPTKWLGGLPPIELLHRLEPAPVIELAREQGFTP